MKKNIAFLLGTLVLWSQSAAACQFIDPKPEDVMALEDNLVIAYPAAISNLPRAARDHNFRFADDRLGTASIRRASRGHAERVISVHQPTSLPHFDDVRVPGRGGPGAANNEV